MLKMCFLFALIFPLTGTAGIFDDPKNLKVLDEEVSAGELRQTMRGMAEGLGVRCTHCHVGEEGKPLSTYDFASDDKENKEKARFMLKMVNDINQHMVTGMKDRSIKVECLTCHRGAIKPILTIDSLKNKFKESGTDAALAHYDDLRDNYFGSHTHNFREWTLINLALAIKDQDPAGAEKVLEKNLGLYPKSFQSTVYLGDINLILKQPKKAYKYYKKAKKMNDQTPPWLEQKIQAVKAQL